MTAPIPRPASVPPLPSSPRQPLTAAATGSKIPRRRTSTSQSVDLASVNSVDADPNAYPTSVPSSPDQRTVSGIGGVGGGGHARRPSRTQFLPPPSSSATGNTPLIERRRSSASASANAANDGTATSSRPRTPSLSIQIPVASSSTQSQVRTQSRPQEPQQRHVTHALDPTAHRQARRMGHSRNASRESTTTAPLSPLKAAGPRTSLRRCSAPVHSFAGPVDAASSTVVPLPRVPRTPYPFSPASGTTPMSARSHRPPMLERTLSESTMATYTSFDLQHPRTPEEEDREVLRRSDCRGSRMRRWLSFWRSPRQGDSDLEASLEDEAVTPKQHKSRSQSAAVDETTALLGGENAPTLRPQTRWEYVWGEIVCYAKHMLPPIFVFVVVVLVIALLAYRQGIRRIAHPPP